MINSNEYAALASHVYWSVREENQIDIPNKIDRIEKFENDPQTGFSYGIFSRDNDIVISFTGTDDLKDWGNDVIGAATQPENLAEYTSAAAQIKQAAQVLIDTRIRYPQAQITLTGHSLGGGIASVLAVLFDVKAEVFDPAPFRASLTDVPKVQDLISSLQNLDNPAAESYRVHLTNYLQALEAAQNKNYFAELAALENANIRGDFMRGEFLQVLRGKNTGIAVDNLNEIDIGAQDISGIGLHSMNLLLAVKLSAGFAAALQGNKQILSLLNDENLLARDRVVSEETDILVHLINSHLKNGQTLDMFARDAQIFTQSERLEKYTQGLFWKEGSFQVVLMQLIEWYGAQTADNSETFFRTQRADFLQYGNLAGMDLTYRSGWANTEIEGFLNQVKADDLRGWYRLAPDVDALLPLQKAQWNIALGAGMEQAADSGLSQFFLGSRHGGGFTASNQDDFLIGCDKTVLNGAGGDDILILNGGGQAYGGAGFDSYYVGSGCTVDDADGQGTVCFNGRLLDTGYFQSGSDGEKIYESPDGALRYILKNQTLLVEETGGGSLTIENYRVQEQDLNIRLIDKPGKDVVFIIDATGSMQDDIDIAKANAIRIANHLYQNSKKENLDTRVGVMTYSNGNLLWITRSADNPKAAVAAIRLVNEQGGWSELVATALLKALNEFQWRAGEEVSKEIYLFGDEPGNDLDLLPQVYARSHELKVQLDGLTRNADMQGENKAFIPIHAIALGGYPATHSVFKSITQNTQGLFFNPNNPQELEDALFDISNTGTAGDDVVEGNGRDNLIDGGKGDDTLKGGLGSDTYIFKPDFGKDVVIEINPGNHDKNRIDLGGFSIRDFRFSTEGTDLCITHNNGRDSIRIKDYFGNEQKIDNITFADKEMDAWQIGQYAQWQDNKARVEYLEDGQDYTGNIYALFVEAGKDSTVKGSIYGDVVIGGQGGYRIDTGLGNDTLVAGSGTGYLRGGFGSDIYIVGKDSGNVRIYDDSGRDILLLKDSVRENISLQKSGSDMVIGFTDNPQHSIVIENQFGWHPAYFNRIEQIAFKDGTRMETQDIAQAVAGQEKTAGGYRYENHYAAAPAHRHEENAYSVL